MFCQKPRSVFVCVDVGHILPCNEHKSGILNVWNLYLYMYVCMYVMLMEYILYVFSGVYMSGVGVERPYMLVFSKVESQL
jgi:hypothetical protein